MESMRLEGVVTQIWMAGTRVGNIHLTSEANEKRLTHNEGWEVYSLCTE